MAQNEPMLPMDQRFIEAEQLSLALEIPKAAPKREKKPVVVCIGYCDNCPHCDNSDNRQ